MYPTKEKILEKEVKFKASTITILKAWKAEYYNDLHWHQINQNDALRRLIRALEANYGKSVVTKIMADIKPCYSPKNHTIYLDSLRPSIISALHEFAHHLKGPSELKACRWSVWLFKKVFPKSCKKLAWNGHMLVKK